MSLIYKLERDTFNSTATLGKIYQIMSDGTSKFIAYTLEDCLRNPGVKVYGKTCIPNGTYRVIVDHSDHFNRNLCHVLNVPGFDGIRIHGGNTAVDTLGCILVAKNRVSATCIQGSLESVFTTAVGAAKVTELTVEFAPNVTPVYQPDPTTSKPAAVQAQPKPVQQTATASAPQGK